MHHPSAVAVPLAPFPPTSWLCAFAALALVAASPAHAQDNDNRGRTQPGLIIETGGRNGACDVVAFTPDGKHLMAVGDDKVVRVWPIKGDQLDADHARALRWSIWREQRGSIYALAYDPKHDRVAIGGMGDRNGRVSILDVASGEVLYTLPVAKTDGNVIWSMAFSPSGNLVAFGADRGAVWVWDLASDAQRDVRRLGGHGLPTSDPHAVNPVRWLAFDGERRLLSAAWDGRVLAWNTGKTDQQTDEVFRFRQVTKLFRVAASPDGKWLAAGGDSAVPGDNTGRTVEVRSLDGRESKIITLPEGNLARCLAFDAKGEHLAVGVQAVPAGAAFQKFAPGPVYLCDLTQDEMRPERVLVTTYFADALAFDPKEPSRLAVAGGADHEVALWRLGRKSAERLSDIAGPGKCLWSVGIDQRNPLKTLLGVREVHAVDPDSPNRRGTGPWRVFDLAGRKWTMGEDFKPVEPIEQSGNWKVSIDPHDAYSWSVVGPDGKVWPLPWNNATDGPPRCYTFLDAAADGGNVRLAVGHYWGASVFELDPKNGPRRVRLFTGHQGEVMALAPSADQKLLVSASRDQTVAAWSLVDWPSQPELGATFSLTGGKLLVDQVDTGSPAWEAGLAAGDEIIEFKFGFYELLFEKDHEVTKENTAPYKVVGSAKDALERLRRPVPGKELFFDVVRAGKRAGGKLTSVRQRPLWRFLPIFERPDEQPEWVLWLWHDYYYDTSTRGDFYIGWQVNGKDGETPTFYRAEQFRRKFHDPDKVSKAIRTGVFDPERASFIAVEPPKVALDAPAALAGPVVPVGLTVEPMGDAPEQKPSRVVVWVNNYAAYTWNAADGRPLPAHIELKRDLFRAGHNEVLAQAYNSDFDVKKQGRGHSNSELKEIRNEAAASGKATLYVLAVGVHDYSKLLQGGKPLGGNHDLLFPDKDAQDIADQFSEQKGGRLFGDVKAVTLLDRQATRKAIRGRLHDVAEQARPDDAFVLFISGHGYAQEFKDGVFRPGTYAFCTPDFDLDKPDDTGLTGDDLADDLAAIRCRKLVLLDTCHSGGATPVGADGMRDLTPSAVGPLILVACDLTQEAREAQGLGHGVFTAALLKAMDDRFAAADHNADGVLDAEELAAEVIAQVPILCKKNQQPPHTPVPSFALEDQKTPWVEKK